MARIEHFRLESKHDGLNLGATMVLPEGQPVALVQFLHGMAEHRMRYLPLMTYLADHGCACVIHDHRGHGESVRSKRDLGYFYADGARGVLRDAHLLTQHLWNHYPGVPLVLVGHSMGSLAARAYAARYGREIDGLILSGSPGENPAAQSGLVLVEVLSLFHLLGHCHNPLLDKIVVGEFSKRFKKQGPLAWLSANKKNVSAYKEDPLCGFSFTMNGYRALFMLMLQAYDERIAIRRGLPVHFMSGEDDPCAPDAKGVHAAMKNMENRGATQVTGKLYPGLRHEIFNEDVQEVWDDLLAKILEMTSKE